MKKNILTIAFSVLSYFSIAQTPTAPSQIEFANVMVNLSPEAQNAVNLEIDKLLNVNAKYQDTKLERLQLYFPIIEKILGDENVPEDFKYICVLESSLDANAVSTSNALGYWQFKEATAREMGLRIDGSVDERKNIEASTKAAATYFKRNNLIYKNWISSILTYSLGANGAANFIPVDWSFASEINFDKNTHNYLIKALANRIAYDYKLSRIQQTTKSLVEFPTNGKSITDIASELKVNADNLRSQNTWLLGDDIPSDKIYNVVVISDNNKSAEISDIVSKDITDRNINVRFPKLTRLTTVSTSSDTPIFYTINGRRGILAQPGDEIPQLAKKAHISVAKLLKFNDMNDNEVAKPGQIYYLKKKDKRAEVPFHTLMPDQTLWDVAQIYGIKERKLLKYNRIKDAQASLVPGSVLYLQHKRKRNKLMTIESIIDTTPKVPENNIEVADAAKPIVKETPTYTKPTQPSTVVVNKPTPPINSAPKTYEDGLKLNDPIFNNNTKPTTPTYTPVKPVEVTPLEPATANKPYSEATNVGVGFHKVWPKETFYSISRKYGLTVTQLKVLNNIGPNETLQTGTILKVSKTVNTPSDIVNKLVTPSKAVPVSNTSVPSYSKPTNTKVIGEVPTEVVKAPVKTYSNDIGYHTVAKGETMYSISKSYGSTVEKIKALNNMTNNTLSVGQKIKVTGVNSNTINYNTPVGNNSTTKGTELSHVVEAKETLYSISKKYGVTVENLKTWNNLSNNELSIGSSLKIKK